MGKASTPFASSFGQKKIEFKKKSKKPAIAEGKLAMCVCMHSAIMATDHLGELCHNIFEESEAAVQLKIHRTKCSGIITCVLHPHFQLDLLHSIKTDFNKFSLFLDESTDLTVKKLLGIGINYFDNVRGKIVSTFLTLVELPACDAESIANAVKNTLTLYKLPLHNLIGIATDNASVMVGINNGLYQKLKLDVPHLVLIKCMCHSLQLAISHASIETLPRNIEFMISETYTWFSKSSVRQEHFRNIYKAINDGCEPKKIVKSCKTRWLSIEKAVFRIINQYLELKTHFETVRVSENCYTAELLYDLYKNEFNLAYLLFLHPVLKEVQLVNKAFEAQNANPLKLLNDLILLIYSIAKRITLPSYKLDPVRHDISNYLDKNLHLGYQCENKLGQLRSNKIISLDDEKIFRERCKNFLHKLYLELKLRVPDNITILEKISFFSVDNMLRHQKLPITPLCQEFIKDESQITSIETQYEKIHFVKWQNTDNTIKFWHEVSSYRNANGENPFKNLCDLALTFLILPFSNAEVERIFSQLNIVKNKTRNKLSLEIVNSILTIRYGLRRHNKCCYNYDLDEGTLNIIGTNETYPHKYENFDLNRFLNNYE